jgi:hypothetical protein
MVNWNRQQAACRARVPDPHRAVMAGAGEQVPPGRGHQAQLANPALVACQGRLLRGHSGAPMAALAEIGLSDSAGRIYAGRSVGRRRRRAHLRREAQQQRARQRGWRVNETATVWPRSGSGSATSHNKIDGTRPSRAPRSTCRCDDVLVTPIPVPRASASTVCSPWTSSSSSVRLGWTLPWRHGRTARTGCPWLPGPPRLAPSAVTDQR